MSLRQKYLFTLYNDFHGKSLIFHRRATHYCVFKILIYLSHRHGCSNGRTFPHNNLLGTLITLQNLTVSGRRCMEALIDKDLFHDTLITTINEETFI